MKIQLWQIASGLGAGTFIAFLFYGIINRFGRKRGEGFQVSVLGKEATAIIAVLIIIIFGGATIVALIFYAPRNGQTQPPPLTNQTLVLQPPITPSLLPTNSPDAIAISWLAFIDSEDYEEAWEQASAYLQNSMTKHDWVQASDTYRKPLGHPLTRSVYHIYPWAMANDGSYQSVVLFQTHFANDSFPSRIEQVGIIESAGIPPKISQYQISTSAGP